MSHGRNDRPWPAQVAVGAAGAGDGSGEAGASSDGLRRPCRRTRVEPGGRLAMPGAGGSRVARPAAPRRSRWSRSAPVALGRRTAALRTGAGARAARSAPLAAASPAALIGGLASPCPGRLKFCSSLGPIACRRRSVIGRRLAATLPARKRRRRHPKRRAANQQSSSAKPPSSLPLCAWCAALSRRRQAHARRRAAIQAQAR